MSAVGNRINALLTGLAACVQVELEKDDRPKLCFAGVVPGAVAAWSYIGDCDGPNGMMWVRLASLYPASALGEPNEEARNCNGTHGFDIEIGVMRAVHWGGEDGEAPTAAELAEDTALLVEDAARVSKGVDCCEALKDFTYRLGIYNPAGPQGGVAGGSWSLTVMF
jgi:hypothetical protein